MKPYTKTENTWLIRNIDGGHERTGPLELSWEASGDWITDDYEPDEIAAQDLMNEWLRTYPDGGSGLVKLYWSIISPSILIHESAPFQDVPWGDFTTHYRVRNSVTGERLNWSRLPVIDKLWGGKRCDKGGFIQSATGWKPSPLQPSVLMALLVDSYKAGATS